MVNDYFDLVEIINQEMLVCPSEHNLKKDLLGLLENREISFGVSPVKS
jgi:hypothetical protein